MLTVEQRVWCGNPVQQFGAGMEPQPEPTPEFGPIANTSGMWYVACGWQHILANIMMPVN
jgi:hypothetical protein